MRADEGGAVRCKRREKGRQALAANAGGEGKGGCAHWGGTVQSAGGNPALRVPDEVFALIRGCHPQLKRKIMAGLLQIATEREFGKSLKDELEGLKSCRINRFRIIYHISSKQTTESLLVRLGCRIRDNDGRPV
jgi:mRNA interferase RelE/StbE